MRPQEHECFRTFTPGPTASFPYLKHGDITVADTTFIMKYLKVGALVVVGGGGQLTTDCRWCRAGGGGG